MNARNLDWRLGISLVLCAWFTADASAQLATTLVQVDCTKKNPKSINEEIQKNPTSLEELLIIEILGMCDESVNISRRDNIVLRGSDPLLDGIRAVSGRTLEIRYSSNITVENLKITGSSIDGIRVGDSGPLFLRNTRLEGNGRFGLRAFRALVGAELTVATGNGVGGMTMGGSTPSSLNCNECTFEANPSPGSGTALRVVRGSSAEVRRSVLDGEFGVFTLSGQVNVINSTVTGSLWSIRAEDQATVSARSGAIINGPFSFDLKSVLELVGVTQTSVNPNVLFGDAYLFTRASGGGTRTTLVSTEIADFSNASFRDTDLGILSCSQGSNAFCDNVTKTSSSCSLCP